MNSNLDIQKIVQKRLSKGQFFEEPSDKTQIYLHHTAGNGNAEGVSRYWNSNDSQIATAFVVGENGTIVQCFSSKHWAWHLGIDSQDFATRGLPYKNLNKLSVGIEICNWGPLTLKGNKFYNYVDREVPTDQVCALANPYKGHLYYHAYTDAQIESVRQLLVYWNQVHGIDLTYNEDIWDITVRALKGENGVFTHNSYRKDKSDVSPQPKLIAMLKALKNG